MHCPDPLLYNLEHSTLLHVLSKLHLSTSAFDWYIGTVIK